MSTRLDQITVDTTITPTTYFVATKNSGGFWSDFIYSFISLISAIYSRFLEFNVQLSADSTTIQNNFLIGATNIEIYSGVKLINSSIPTYNQLNSSATLTVTSDMFTVDNVTGTITFGGTRIAGEVFCIKCKK